jgi:putative acetyltransferase
VKIRASTVKDKESIRRVHLGAFAEPEGETVSQLAVDLLEDKTAIQRLSLVAEQANKIVGHILFTSVIIDGAVTEGAYIMAPLAVAKNYQGCGIGTDLIKQGLKILKEGDAEFVLVYGDPKYYSRTGFILGHDLKPPHKLEYPDAWMAQGLKEGALQRHKGTIQCAASLNSPEHW